jgi:filamentous hemagglutinin
VTTAEHPFYTSENEWIEAGELQLGDDIRAATWTTGEVEAITIVTQPQRMYNFTVAAAHTYFVGDGQWLVHNCGTLIESGKIEDFLFGRASGNAHNVARTNQNALQMSRLGIPDTEQGYALLRNHLEGVGSSSDNVIRTYSDQYGSYEIRESLFAGPSGQFAKFESTWQVMADGTRRLTTVIPYGGP